MIRYSYVVLFSSFANKVISHFLRISSRLLFDFNSSSGLTSLLLGSDMFFLVSAIVQSASKTIIFNGTQPAFGVK